MKYILTGLICLFQSINLLYGQCNTIVVETTTDIASLSCPIACTSTIIRTLGYASVGDGGDAEYRVVANPSSPKLTIDFLICNSGGVDYYAMLDYQGSMRVEQGGFLASNSGTDNNVRLATICSYMKIQRSGGVLYLSPEKVYNVLPNSTIGPGTEWTLDGQGSTLFMESQTNVQSLFNFNGSDVDNIRFENVIFDGEPDEWDQYHQLAKTSNCRIVNLFSNFGDVSFDNVVFKNNYQPISVHNGGNTITMTNCEMLDMPAGIGGGPFTLKLDQCRFDNSNLVTDPTKYGNFDLYHYIYVTGVDIYCNNTVFSNKLGEGIRTLGGGKLFLNNVSFDDGGRIFVTSEFINMNNIHVSNQNDWLHLMGADAVCEINNLTYIHEVNAQNRALPIYATRYAGIGKIKVSNSYFEGTMTFYMDDFEHFDFSNVTLVNPMAPPFHVFHQNAATNGESYASFDQLKVIIDEIPNAASMNGSSIFTIKQAAGYDRTMAISNSQFILNAPDDGGVFGMYLAGTRRISFDHVGAKGFSTFIHGNAEYSQVFINDLYEIGSFHSFPDMYKFDQSTDFTPRLEQLITCNTSGIDITLRANYPEFTELCIKPLVGGTVDLINDASSASTQTIDGVNYTSGTPITFSGPVTLIRVGDNWIIK